MFISPVIQKRLEMQGFVVCNDDPAFAAVVPWLRFTPATAVLAIGLGTALASPLILLALVPIAVIGAITGVHPVDLIYNYGVRHLTGTPPLPKNPVPRRFGIGVMAVALTITGWLFLIGATSVGYVLGAVLTMIPAINVITPHFCILSLIYRALFDRQAAKRSFVNEGK